MRPIEHKESWEGVDWLSNPVKDAAPKDAEEHSGVMPE